MRTAPGSFSYCLSDHVDDPACEMRTQVKQLSWFYKIQTLSKIRNGLVMVVRALGRCTSQGTTTNCLHFWELCQEMRWKIVAPPVSNTHRTMMAASQKTLLTMGPNGFAERFSCGSVVLISRCRQLDVTHFIQAVCVFLLSAPSRCLEVHHCHGWVLQEQSQALSCFQ
jgi:hypothetical protein